jgi:hypothetical protein
MMMLSLLQLLLLVLLLRCRCTIAMIRACTPLVLPLASSHVLAEPKHFAASVSASRMTPLGANKLSSSGSSGKSCSSAALLPCSSLSMKTLGAPAPILCPGKNIGALTRSAAVTSMSTRGVASCSLCAVAASCKLLCSEVGNLK